MRGGNNTIKPLVNKVKIIKPQNWTIAFNSNHN